MKFLLLTSLCFLTIFAGAQPPAAGVVLHKDPRIDVLLKKQANINKTAVIQNSRGQYKGYRVMAMNTNDRDLAYKTKAQLLSRFPEYQVYVSYQTPFFRLKIGDFLKRDDAEELRKRIAVMMTKGVYIVPDIVIVNQEEKERMINDN